MGTQHESASEDLAYITRKRPPDADSNPVGNITSQDKLILAQKGLSEEEYCKMWELPMVITPGQDEDAKTSQDARYECLEAYDE
ncbi:TPA: hypothetical protein DCR79_02295 [Patescibacteria group bacterium]|uniref:Uncharacterized protein n=1 Tax=Candidatus Woesebacteria bacterium GW2011_GWB1_39_10b TaxID=1618573 RepID=A0A0G0P4S3_9BACT|nr:MAG: hypothetical protein UT19_C0019G0010 [Candidatus Woesebacteria bacterium GW2011_GWB1_39_10b]HAR55093.1 hypothetical protein [Patescibacteria group bacterium]HCR42138.1 hypothetical protein [Patescibacteria group bacterium]